MRAIYLAGTDGSGKSTYLEEIIRKLLSQNVKTHHIWIRSPKIFSKPLMAYCRLAGLTKYKTIDGIRYGKHEFYKSKLISYLFPLLQLIDFKIKWFLEQKKIKKNKIILFDRFSLDTLADLMVDTHRMDLHKTWIGKEFIKMIPQQTVILMMYVDEDIIRARKKDTLYDEQLGAKIDIYSLLSEFLSIKKIDNNRTQSIVKQEIFEEIGVDERN